MAKQNNEKSESRFVKGRRQEALAEIEGWVGGSREDVIKTGTAKVASQPPKNITEQKLLDSHLYDMSRQRFNFIVHCQWEKKLFLEKQKRKTAVMRDLLRNVDLSGFSENPFGINQSNSAAFYRKQKLDGKEWDKESANTDPKNTLPLLTSSTDGVFVTHKNPRVSDQKTDLSVKSQSYSHSLRAHTATTVQSKVVRSEKSHSKIWPLNDSRYTRLNDILCETYPKRSRHLQGGRANALTAKATSF